MWLTLCRGASEASAEEASDAAVRGVLEDEELRGWLLDPAMQSTLLLCAQPEGLARVMREQPDAARKIRRMIDAGLLRSVG